MRDSEFQYWQYVNPACMTEESDSEQGERILTHQLMWRSECMCKQIHVHFILVHTRTLHVMVLPTLIRSGRSASTTSQDFNHHSINFTISLCIKYYRNTMIVLLLMFSGYHFYHHSCKSRQNPACYIHVLYCAIYM